MIKLEITIEHTDGRSETYITNTPEWSKWERKTGKSVYSATPEKVQELGIGAFYQQADFLFLAHAAYVRANAGKPTKSYDIWELSVEGITVAPPEDPKVIPSEALTE